MDKFLPLLCHPATPAKGVTGVEAMVRHHEGRWAIDYIVTGGTPLMPPHAAPERTDGLWQTTCFELFVRQPDGGYVEFNFSPSTQWAAYRFTGYRQGMTDEAIPPPVIDRTRQGIHITLDFPTEPAARIALTAVIEEADGTKSYWSLTHPPGKPDFHHPDCFALPLSAGKGA